MSDHNIIQIETNIKILEEKQSHQIKKSNLSYRNLNFFNEAISWANIDADLFNTSWDMLLTDVKTDEMYKIIINIFLEIYKNIFCQRKILGNIKYQGTEGLWWDFFYFFLFLATNHQTKENVLNQIK